MGKSFNDRNRKKGAERAYRKTKRSDKGKRGNWYGGEEFGSESRKPEPTEHRSDPTIKQDWT